MSSSDPPARARSFRFRRGTDTGPRAGLRDLLPYLAEHRTVLLVVVGISVLGALASLAQPLLLQQVVQRVQHGQALGDVIVLMAVVVAFAAVTNGVQHYLLQRTGTSVVLTARQRLIRHLLRLPVAEFDRRRTGDLVSRIGTDTTLLYAVLTQGLVDAAGGAVTFVGALIGMLVVDPVLLGLTVLIILFAILVVGGLARRIRSASRAQQDAVGRLTAEVERSIGAVRTIRASGATERETDGVIAVAKEAWAAGIGVAGASAPVVPVASLTLNLAFLVVIGVGGYQVAAGTTTIANLSAFLFFLFLLVMPLGQAFGAASSVASALGALGRITEVLDLPAESAKDPEDADLVGPANADAAPAAPALEFDAVAFAYAGEDGPTDVLHDVTFAVPRGTRTALVGPSGAGKSTMLALLERFYDVSAGTVRVGGVDVRRLPREVLRAQFGYVEQDAPALAGTIRDNLMLAAPLATEQDCLRALDAVNLREAVLRHPHGLDAPVGEEGVLLSGGERQRLAIARALLADAPILLLDESTSNLDGRNEQLLRESLKTASVGRTVVVIAHRLSTVVDADQIVVVDAGRVLARGTHDELVDTSPLYRELAASQLLV
ncbi:ABC transporter ATP-binding protein [Amnibacterium sp. CER49]|uniref:ABC transporter ATP-binding protein n=1 Tax=Amnibacterium sp. CER49 TaxID=3039161 RepID=UPI002448F754|nr:ABC transporter ATP-binding protein [Amnibacterium sp. CER49]MDH2443191.1 ABC transporter ATP-binding protein [Amnibacterium sp. CER49]